MTLRSLSLLTCAALLLAPASAAQAGGGGKLFKRYQKPLTSVHVDLDTGTVRRGPRVNNRAATTVIDFNNNDLSGFVGVDTGNGFCEWFDAGVKGYAGNGSDLMSQIVLPYCSAKLAPGSGGPGGSVKLGFYEGYTWGGGAPTTTVAAFTLTGLPGNTASSSFFSGFSCYFMSMDFSTLVPFADGPIGYSWKFLDTGTTGTLAGTWPFLACVVSCSGVYLQVDGQGMTDIIDEYCPPGYLRSSFTFGTTSGTFTSVAIDIREAADFTATQLSYNATLSPNGDTLAANTAVIGSSWTTTLTRNPTTAAGTYFVQVRTTRVAGNGYDTPIGQRLIDGTLLGTVNGTHDGTNGSTPPMPVPRMLAFLCKHYAAQATTTASSVMRLSSALEGTSGTN